MNLEEDCRWIS